MTLIIGLANQYQVILVSDRRLSCNGKVVEDESNKAAVFVCRNARLAVAFTGLAQAGNFLTRRWLLEALSASAQPDYLMEPTIKRFCIRANHDISKLKLQRRVDKRLSVVMAGYSYDDISPRGYFWLVSNFEGLGEQHPTLSEPLDEFNIHYYEEKRPTEEHPGIIILFGASKAITKEQGASLQDLLQRNKPANAIVGKAVETLHIMADSPLSANVIGKQCTSIILPSDPNLPPTTQYHSSKVTTKIFEPSFVEARGDEYGVYVIDSPELEFRDSSDRPLIAKVPKVGRNDLCPCGSGKRYKRCHGQF